MHRIQSLFHASSGSRSLLKQLNSHDVFRRLMSNRSPYHQVWSWGAGAVLGTGEKDDKHAPELIEEFKRKRFISCSAAWQYTFAVTDRHDVYSWGKFVSGLLQPARRVDVRSPVECDQLKDKQIERVLAGRGHCMAIAKNGTVYSWGSCELGQRGHGVDGDQQELWLPARVEPLCSPPAPAPVQLMAVGLDHNLAMTSDRQLLAWGYGDEGQLGLGEEQLMVSVPTPLQSERLAGKDIVQLYCGGDFSAARTRAGEVYVWGSNYHGQLGLGDKKNRYQPTFLNYFKSNPIREISLGSAHMLILTESGKLYSCGWGQDGRLGVGNTEEDKVDPTLIRSLFGEKIEQIYAGGGQNFVVTKEGKVFTFGLGMNGRLGLGNERSVHEPTHLPFFDDKKIVTMALGMDHSIAITEED